MVWLVIFPKSTKVRFDGAPLELLTILVNLRADQPFWWIGFKVELEVFDKKKWNQIWFWWIWSW